MQKNYFANSHEAYKKIGAIDNKKRKIFFECRLILLIGYCTRGVPSILQSVYTHDMT